MPVLRDNQRLAALVFNLAWRWLNQRLFSVEFAAASSFTWPYCMSNRSIATLGIIPAASFATLQAHWWAPDVELKPWVQCFWTTRAHCHNRTAEPDKMYPDAGASLIFEFSADQAECFYFYNTSMVQHQWTTCADRLSVRLRPGAASQLFQSDFLALGNALVQLEDRLLPGLTVLMETMAGCSPSMQVRLLQQWLMTKFAASADRHSPVLDLVSQLHASVVNPYQYAAERGMSRRTLERNLRREVGISPKQLHSFNRLRKARGLLMDSELTLSDIALQAGYYDQAHFTNRFHTETRETPSEYRRRKMSQFSKAR